MKKSRTLLLFSLLSLTLTSCKLTDYLASFGIFSFLKSSETPNNSSLEEKEEKEQENNNQN